MSNTGKIIKIDQQVIDAYTDPAQKYFLLKESEAIALLSQIPYFEWSTRWKNLTYTKKELLDFTASIADQLMNPQESAIMNCDDVEDCLDISPTIAIIEGDIITNTVSTTNNTTNITNITNNPPDGNLYIPPVPIALSADACQISGHLADEIGNYIAQVDTYATEPTVIDALNSAVSGNFNYAFNELATILDTAINGAGTPLFTDYSSQEALVHEELYCSNNFDKQTIASWCIANLTRGQEIADMINSVSLATWEQWLSVGEYATGYSCVGYCPPTTWTQNFDLINSNAYLNILSAGVWNNGIGIQPTASGGDYSIIVEILLPGGVNRTITEVSWTIDWTSLQVNRGITIYTKTTAWPPSIVQATPAPLSGSNIYTWTGSEALVTATPIWARQSVNGQFKITHCTLKGLGTNPF